MEFAQSGVLLLLGDSCTGHSGGDLWLACRHRVGVTVARQEVLLENLLHWAIDPMTPPLPSPVAGGLRRRPDDASLLSFVAAFVDTCGFVGLFQLFTAHVTGNFVLMGAALVNRRGDVLAKLVAFPVFILAVALTVVVADVLRRRGRSRVGTLLWAEAMLLAAAALLPFLVGSPQEADDVRTLVIGMTMVLAMGLQNAQMRLDLAALPPTTVMTGNVTQVTVDVMALWREDGAQREIARDRLRRMAGPIVAFLIGAASGAGGYAVMGFTSLLLPAAVCAVIARRHALR
jgi:uncharacterized membrane protein YoaK (UPF0700 family)